MKHIEIKKLNQVDKFRHLLYHIKGLSEAVHSVAEHIEELDQAIDLDSERATDILGRLEAEISFHLPYHASEAAKGLREASEWVYRQCKRT